MTLPADLARSALESAPDAIIVIDAAGNILFANHQVSALFGYSADELESRPVEMLLPERFRERHVTHREHYTNTVRVRPMGAGLELFALRRDGSEFPVEVSLSPIGDPDQPLVAAAIRDITARARAEHELREARAAADRANLAKSRFLATASHDLRQPLQALFLLNGTLRRLLDNDDTREVLEQQELALAAMSRLLNALLDVSKLESGAVRPEISDFPVSRLLDELQREFTGIAGSKGLALHVEPTDQLARTDATLLGQALKNLVANAIKYTSKGHVLLRALPSAGAVRIEVCDTGRGIDAAHLPFIFDEFYQIGVATNTSRDGFGLGLSIVQNVARLLGLQVDVQSQPGEGSLFAIEVPCSGTADADTSSAARPRTATQPRAGAAQHLLLVEDDPAVRSATRMFLKGEGYRVSSATSAGEADTLLEAHPDLELVISDYHLGEGRTGADVVGAARARFGPGFRAILVTGDTTPAIMALQRDARLRVTSKPINPDELLALIRSLLRH